MSSQAPAKVGGLKGFFQRAGNSFKSGGLFAKDSASWLVAKGAAIGFIVATTSMITLMPLLFEIAREGQVRCVNRTMDRC